MSKRCETDASVAGQGTSTNDREACACGTGTSTTHARSDMDCTSPAEPRDQEPADDIPTAGELSRLPAEILLRILEHLPRPALARCLVVNSVFCSLALPLLYVHVRLSEFGPWPEFEHAPSNPVSRAGTPGPFDERTGTRPAFLSRSRLVEHVRRLDIVPHNTAVCGSSGLLHWWHALPPLPRLQVVRVFLMATWSGNRVFHTNVDAHDPDRQPDRNCAALTHLRAATLVVRGLTLAHNTVPRHELPPRFEDGVRHYIAVFQPDHPYFLARNAEHTAQRQGVLFRSRIPHLTTRTTVIFWPPGKGYAWRAGPGNHTLSWELIWSHASSLFANLAAWMTQRQPPGNNHAAVTIVNVGALQRVDDGQTMSDATYASMRDNVLDVFRSAVEERFPDEERRKAALASVRIVSMEEWLAEAEWRDVFEEVDVRPWLGSNGTPTPAPKLKNDALYGLQHIPLIPSGGQVTHLPMFQLAVSDS